MKEAMNGEEGRCGSFEEYIIYKNSINVPFLLHAEITKSREG